MPKKAFTLLEILLVIASIGILAAIVIVAINPQRQLSQVRDAERRASVNTLHSALEQYLIDEGTYPIGITMSYQDVCDTGSASLEQGSTESNCVDLRGLVPRYIAAIPTDPRSEQHTGYRVAIHPDNQRVSVYTITGEVEPQSINRFYAQAEGGNELLYEQDGVYYRIHSFTDVGEGTFNVIQSGDADVLVVGGGAGGASERGGAGGAGGLVFYPGYSLVQGDVNVFVGSGSSGVALRSQNPVNGQNSYFDAIIALGGGAPGSRDGVREGMDGGSGGGARDRSQNIESAGLGIQSSQGGVSGNPYGFGNSGGAGYDATGNSHGGGGGGAGEPGGSNTPGSNGGNSGGDGLFEVNIEGMVYQFSDIFGLANTGEFINDQYWYAGGGAAHDQAGNPVEGGRGGGGSNTQSGNSVDALPNTGGGGGGANGDGGSGVVIIRYEISEEEYNNSL